MDIDHATLQLADTDRQSIRLADFRVVASDQSNQLAVLKLPEHVFQGTVLADHPGDEAGASIELTTTDDLTYEGFVEVVATTTNSRLYWCGVDFQPIRTTP